MFSEEEIREWELLPLNVRVLTSQQMGAWLYYRDRNRDKRVNAELLDKVAEKLKAEMIETYPKNINGVKAPTPFTHFSYRGMCNLLDDVIAEMKAEVEK